MNKIVSLKHSKFGVASCVLAATTWFYLAVLIYLFFYSESFAKAFNGIIQPTTNKVVDFNGFGTALLSTAILFLVIPFAAHSIGFIFGLIGAFQKSKRKTFAIAGLVMNVLIFIIPLIFQVINVFLR